MPKKSRFVHDPVIDEPKEFVKEVKVQCSQYKGNKKKKLKGKSRGQYSIQLPVQFVDLLNIQKGDIFEIRIPLRNKSNYSIKLKKEIKK